eukprot:16606-Heterococcus_DN1.PRE.2
MCAVYSRSTDAGAHQRTTAQCEVVIMTVLAAHSRHTVSHGICLPLLCTESLRDVAELTTALPYYSAARHHSSNCAAM